MHMTSPDLGSNLMYGTKESKNYRSLQPSGLGGTVNAGNVYGFNSENYAGSSMNMTNDARISE